MFSTYLVIRMDNRVSLVGKSVVHPGRLYWFGGFSYTVFTPEIEVLHTYHTEDFMEAEDPEDAVEIDFWKRWNPPAPDGFSGTGWLAPSGIFYGCEYAEHDSLAKQLVATLYGELTGYTERLEREGWLRLQSGIVAPLNKDITQAQFDTLYTICQQLTLGILEKERLERTLRYYSKKDIL